MNVDHHAPTVDIPDLPVRRFSATCPAAVESHQQDAIERKLSRIDQARHFLRAENLRQADDLPRIGRLGNAPVLLQHLDIEEPQSAKALCHGVSD